MGDWEWARLGDVCVGVVTNIAQKDLVNRNGVFPIYGASGLIKSVDFFIQSEPYIAVVKDGAGVGRVSRMPAQSSVIGTMQSIIPNENILSDYLFYVMKRMDLARHFTGSTIPHIYFKDYKNRKIPLPPLHIQRKIVDVLDASNILIEKRKTQIDKLDMLVKSRFVEMFGDPVTNPMGWDTDRVGNLTENIIAGESLNGEARLMLPGEKAVLKVSAVTYGYFKADEYKVLLNADEIKKNVYPKKGDLLFSRANTREMVGATALVEKDYPDLILPDKLWKLVLSSQVNSVYMKFALSSDTIRSVLSKLATGTSGSMYNVSMDKLRNIIVSVPPLPLQNRFAEFVRAADKSKFEMQQGLHKLELLYKSLMQKCIKGEVLRNEKGLLTEEIAKKYCDKA